MSATHTIAAQIRELAAGETLSLTRGCGLCEPHARASKGSSSTSIVCRPASYRLVDVFVPDREQTVAVAGFRVGDSLAWGHYLYVDDLSTAPDARRQGHAGALLDWRTHARMRPTAPRFGHRGALCRASALPQVWPGDLLTSLRARAVGMPAHRGDPRYREHGSPPSEHRVWRSAQSTGQRGETAGRPSANRRSLRPGSSSTHSALTTPQRSASCRARRNSG
jgi:GNAT superfamily N-acetyltransferase